MTTQFTKHWSDDYSKTWVTVDDPWDQMMEIDAEFLDQSDNSLIRRVEADGEHFVMFTLANGWARYRLVGQSGPYQNYVATLVEHGDNPPPPHIVERT